VSDSSNDIPKRNAPEMTDAELAAAARMISVDARKVVLLGTVLFFATFVVLLPFWSWLGEHGHRVWLWTALAGTVLGVAAMPLIRKHTGEGRLG
jgi:hypothetical protein